MLMKLSLIYITNLFLIVFNFQFSEILRNFENFALEWQIFSDLLLVNLVFIGFFSVTCGLTYWMENLKFTSQPTE